VVTHLPQNNTPVVLAIEPVPTSQGVFLRIATNTHGGNIDTETAVAFGFDNLDSLLMASANRAFVAGAIWELATRLDDEFAEPLINDPACELPATLEKLEDSNDSDMDVDFSRYQHGQYIFAAMGATMDPVR